MTTTNSGYHHHHRHHRQLKFLYLEVDQRINYDDDKDNLDSIWNTNNEDGDDRPINPEKAMLSKTMATSIKRPLKPQRTLPINVPDWSKILRYPYKISEGDYDEEWLPPHEYLARVRSASLSVHEGVGRTLKGRDLSRLRNYIWKQTGFED
ncbi:uncharacterized protein LOC112522203 [Cynara cardunculus var. scolymus]|uniref:Senescence regulator n=1 Tax=Cynara cardunculus var. scolymus TaxID=59895 RepID=A0A118JU01_CYNCS|nr:uncharacterized protein LOC112522203 [Cynara cardunculus var. scolymus]KVH90447.1 Senescence regulator [Cynara cardunculus var. scolymus]